VGILDHLKQHAVRGDQARLAFDDHGEAGNILGAGRQFAVDQLQFPGVDVKLGGRQIFRGQAFADRNGKASADQRAVAAIMTLRCHSKRIISTTLKPAEARSRGGRSSGLAGFIGWS
jgi:hypothetical protein